MEEELYDSAGVDLTLIRASLAMSPAERIDYMLDVVDFVFDVWKQNGIEPPDRNTEDAY